MQLFLLENNKLQNITNKIIKEIKNKNAKLIIKHPTTLELLNVDDISIETIREDINKINDTEYNIQTSLETYFELYIETDFEKRECEVSIIDNIHNKWTTIMYIANIPIDELDELEELVNNFDFSYTLEFNDIKELREFNK